MESLGASKTSWGTNNNWVLVALAMVVAGLFAFKQILFGNGPRKRANLPPSPGALPVVGSFPFLGAVPGEPAHRMFGRVGEKFGPIAYLRLGANPTIVISNGDIAKLVLKDLDHVFASRPYISAGKFMGMDFHAVSFAASGPYCNRLRKIYKELLGSKRVGQGDQAREQELFRSLGAVYHLHKVGKVVNLSAVLKELGLNMIIGLVFGWKDGKISNGTGTVKLADLRAVIGEAVHLAGEFNFGDFITIARWLDLQGVIGRMRKLSGVMRSTAIALVEEFERSGRKSPNSPDASALDFLLSLEGEDKLSSMALSGILYDLIIAGSDTSANASEWIIAELLRQPKLGLRLQAELDSVVGRDRFVTEADMPNLPFLKAAVTEGLRLHPSSPLGLPHFSTAACELAGYHIPKGTTALINFWAIGRDPKHWPEPLRFDPDRFLVPDQPDLSVFGNTYHLLPFGSGRRGCPGARLGLGMVQLFVANFMHAFDFQAAGELTRNEDIDVVSEKIGIISNRAHDLFVNAVPRLNPKLYEKESGTE